MARQSGLSTGGVRLRSTLSDRRGPAGVLRALPPPLRRTAGLFLPSEMPPYAHLAPLKAALAAAFQISVRVQ